jgi:hypothetical protein
MIRREPEKAKKFRKSVLNILEEGQELSSTEKMLVNRIITKFINDYKEVTDEYPPTLWGIIYLIAVRLENYEFYLPKIERWRREDIEDLVPYLKAIGKTEAALKLALSKKRK